MRQLIVSSLFLALSVLPEFTQAHGEDKLGPNKGYIRMPGAFHTEVVPNPNGFKVYLTDVSFKEPMTKDSSVEFTLKKGSQETKGVCQAALDHFICELPKGLDLKSGQLIVKASRNKAQGGLATYPLPLQVMANH
jgi:hypothetical protein